MSYTGIWIKYNELKKEPKFSAITVNRNYFFHGTYSNVVRLF